MFSRWKHRKQAAALDQLWDEIQSTDGSRLLGLTERPVEVESIASVLAHDDAPAIDPDYSATLLKDLMKMQEQRHRTSPNGFVSSVLLASRSTAAGQRRAYDERPNWDGSPRIRTVAGFAVLAILLVLGSLAMRPGPTSELPAIPAAVMQDQIQSTTLVDISFPPGGMRGDEGAQLIFGEYTVAPNSKIGFRISCDSLDIHPFYVLEGTLAAEVAGTSFVLRAGATEWETIPAGQPAEIHAGETWYFENTKKDGMTNLRNPGSGELRYMWVGVRQNSSTCNQSPPSGQLVAWHYLEDPTDALDDTQPIRLVLRKMTVPIGGTIQGELGDIPIPSADLEALGARQWAKIVSGSLSMTRKVDGEEESTSTLPKGTMITQLVSRSDEGEQLTISNFSDVPVQLVVLDIVVGDPGAQGGVLAPLAASPVPNN
jgi:hypothetical protein